MTFYPKMEKKIIVIGNSCGGKTQFSKKLHQIKKIPVFHVDSYQYNSQLEIQPLHETIKVINSILRSDCWIIDGYGPLDNLLSRLAQAELVIFIDLPLYQHYFWFFKRSIQLIYKKKREELPPNSVELKYSHLMKNLKSIYKVHKLMRPEMIRILSKDQFKSKVKILKSKQEMSTFLMQAELAL